MILARKHGRTEARKKANEEKYLREAGGNIMNRGVFAFLALLCAFTAASPALSQENKYAPTWESLDSRPIPSWFDDAKFGIFIHWGVYSVPAWGAKGAYAEWYWHDLVDGNIPEWQKHLKHKELQPTQRYHLKTYGKDFKYQDFAPMFKAEQFDPAAWAELFRNAGARYVVLTSKHHEGFCLWPSEYAWNWNSVDVGPHRDLAGDLTKAVRAAGLRMGFYYSLYEWYNPMYRNHVEDYVDHHMIPQMKELVEKYQPSVLWTDGEWEHPSDVWKSREFLAWLFNEAPGRDEVVVNDRWGKETRTLHGGFFTSEYGGGTAAGLKIDASHKWEENQGIGRSFGYNRNESATDYKTSADLIHMLVEIVSHGGNFLLDVGPTADGRIPDIMRERLLDIGAWLRVNGEAIYGTHPWRVAEEGEAVRYTSKGNVVYAICTKWPGTELTLSAPKPEGGATVTMLGREAPLKWKLTNGKLRIEVPALSTDELPSKDAWAFRLAGMK